MTELIHLYHSFRVPIGFPGSGQFSERRLYVSGPSSLLGDLSKAQFASLPTCDNPAPSLECVGSCPEANHLPGKLLLIPCEGGDARLLVLSSTDLTSASKPRFTFHSDYTRLIPSNGQGDIVWHADYSNHPSYFNETGLAITEDSTGNAQLFATNSNGLTNWKSRFADWVDKIRSYSFDNNVAINAVMPQQKIVLANQAYSDAACVGDFAQAFASASIYADATLDGQLNGIFGIKVSGKFPEQLDEAFVYSKVNGEFTLALHAEAIFNGRFVIPQRQAFSIPIDGFPIGPITIGPQLLVEYGIDAQVEVVGDAVFSAKVTLPETDVFVGKGVPQSDTTTTHRDGGISLALNNEVSMSVQGSIDMYVVPSFDIGITGKVVNAFVGIFAKPTATLSVSGDPLADHYCIESVLNTAIGVKAELGSSPINVPGFSLPTVSIFRKCYPEVLNEISNPDSGSSDTRIHNGTSGGSAGSTNQDSNTPSDQNSINVVPVNPGRTDTPPSDQNSTNVVPVNPGRTDTPPSDRNSTNVVPVNPGRTDTPPSDQNSINVVLGNTGNAGSPQRDQDPVNIAPDNHSKSTDSRPLSRDASTGGVGNSNSKTNNPSSGQDSPNLLTASESPSCPDTGSSVDLGNDLFSAVTSFQKIGFTMYDYCVSESADNEIFTACEKAQKKSLSSVAAAGSNVLARRSLTRRQLLNATREGANNTLEASSDVIAFDARYYYFLGYTSLKAGQTPSATLLQTVSNKLGAGLYVENTLGSSVIQEDGTPHAIFLLQPVGLVKSVRPGFNYNKEMASKAGKNGLDAASYLYLKDGPRSLLKIHGTKFQWQNVKVIPVSELRLSNSAANPIGLGTAIYTFSATPRIMTVDPYVSRASRVSLNLDGTPFSPSTLYGSFPDKQQITFQFPNGLMNQATIQNAPIDSSMAFQIIGAKKLPCLVPGSYCSGDYLSNNPTDIKVTKGFNMKHLIGVRNANGKVNSIINPDGATELKFMEQKSDYGTSKTYRFLLTTTIEDWDNLIQSPLPSPAEYLATKQATKENVHIILDANWDPRFPNSLLIGHFEGVSNNLDDPCTSNAMCASGFCNKAVGKCTPKCYSQKDCDEKEVCYGMAASGPGLLPAGVCVTVTTSSVTKTCSNDQDCSSGFDTTRFDGSSGSACVRPAAVKRTAKGYCRTTCPYNAPGPATFLPTGFYINAFPGEDPLTFTCVTVSPATNTRFEVLDRAGQPNPGYKPKILMPVKDGKFIWPDGTLAEAESS